MGKTSIEWAQNDDGTPGKSWNPARGCSMVSAGCQSCYAMKMAHRFSGPGKPYEGLTELGPTGPRWNGSVRFVPEKLDEPLRRRKPTTYFVNSMSDLFHESLTDEQIASVFGVIAACPQHTFLVLTKRPGRMLAWIFWAAGLRPQVTIHARVLGKRPQAPIPKYPWPLPNVWVGVSIEDQTTADERIPLLLQTPASKYFVSYEPGLGPVDLRPWLGFECTHPGAHVEPDTNATICSECDESSFLDLVIAGGESGPRARPFDLGWARSLVEQCKAAGVACFYKQGGSGHACEHSAKGGCLDCMPEDLRVREMPR